MKALTCSARDYVESRGRKLEDYTLEPVFDATSLSSLLEQPNLFSGIKYYDFDAITDLRFSITRSENWIQYSAYATGLKRK